MIVGAQTLTLDRIVRNPEQPRQRFTVEELADLAQSVRSVGLIQPVVVQPGDEDNTYQIVDGERRWRASLALAVAQHRDPDIRTGTLLAFARHVIEDIDQFIRTHQSLLAETEIDAVITDQGQGDDTRLLIRSTVANLHRSDLNDIELAAAYQRMSDDGMSDAEIGQTVGKSRSSVANARRLMQIPADMQQAVAAGVISARTAAAYLPVLEIKPHKMADAWPPLIKDPSFHPASDLPTPGALRKRLCQPDKYGVLTSDQVRGLVERITEACTPITCVDCGVNCRSTRATYEYLPNNQYRCRNCDNRRLRDEQHTRYCIFCGHEQVLDGLDVRDTSRTTRVTCRQCNKTWPGIDWRKEPKPKPVERPPDREDRQPSTHASDDTNDTVYPCHNCGEALIQVDPKADTVVCEACGEEWGSLNTYHQERAAYEQPKSATNGHANQNTQPVDEELKRIHFRAKTTDRFALLIYNAGLDRLIEVDAWLDDLERELIGVCAQTEAA